MSHRSKHPSMLSLAPWERLLYPGGDRNNPIVVGRGGQLIATAVAVGRDMRFKGDDEVTLYVTNVASRLSVLGTQRGWAIHADTCTFPSEYLMAPWCRSDQQPKGPVASDTAPPVAVLVDGARAALHQHLVEPVTFLTFTMQPPPRVLAWQDRLFRQPKRKSKTVEDQFNAYLGAFNEAVSATIEQLRGVLGNCSRCDADTAYSYYHYVLTGRWRWYEAPRISGVSVESLFQAKRERDAWDEQMTIHHAPDEPMHVRVVSTFAMPQTMRAEYFDDLLLKFGFPMRWVNRALVVPIEAVQGHYQGQMLKAAHAQKGFLPRLLKKIGASSDEEVDIQDPLKLAATMRAHADVESTDGETAGAHLTTAIVLYDEDEETVQRRAEALASYFRVEKRKPAVVEEADAAVVFAIAVPGQLKWAHPSDRLPMTSVVECMSLSLPDTGPSVRDASTLPVLMQYTVNGSLPLRVDFSVGTNRHVCRLGNIGGGKSTDLQFCNLMQLARYENSRVIMLDADIMESTSPSCCVALGGEIVSFRKGTAALQPFRHCDTEDGFITGLRWIQTCIKAHGQDWQSPRVMREAEDAIRHLATFPAERRTTGLLAALSQDEIIRQCLRPYCEGGVYGQHVGGARDVLSEAPYVVVDLSELINAGPMAVPVIGALIDKVVRIVNTHEGPVRVPIDEAWQALTLLAPVLDDALRRWRKKGSALDIVAHSPTDIVSSDVGAIIGQNVKSWVVYADPSAAENEDYKKLRFTDFQRSLIAELRLGQCFIRVGSTGHVADQCFTPLELWICGQGGKEGRARFTRLMREHGRDGFAAAFLREGGFDHEANEIERIAGERGVHRLFAAE